MTNIFVSSRIEELRKEREVVKKTIEELARKYGIDIALKMFESEPAPPSTDTREASLFWVKESDALICIYYKTISQIVKDEFRNANDVFMPIFIFKKKVNESELNDEEKKEYRKLIKFIEEEVKPPEACSSKENYIYKEFESKENLAKEIEKAILCYYQRRFEFEKIPEKYLIMNDETANRIKNVYAKPKRYDEAENKLKGKRLLIISGSAHLGKTSMGYYLGISLRNKIARRFLRFPEDGSLSELERLNCSIILFDDPFGGSTFEYFNVADNIKRVRDLLQNNNYIIITSRKEVLIEAIQKSKIGEENLGENIFELTTNDYTDAIFKDILYKHLDYYNVSEEGRKIVGNNEDFIISELRFPHNYEVFVKNELEGVTQRKKGLWKAVKNAKEIERACGKWFSRFYLKDQEMFSFIMAVALFNAALWGEKYFLELCERTMKAMGLSVKNLNSYDLDRLKSQASSYILQKPGVTKFEHPSYEEGVFSEIEKNYLGSVEKVALEIPWFRALFEDAVELSGIFRKTITVKYASVIVEKGSFHDVLESPLHPFTKYLLENLSKEITELNARVRVLTDKEFLKRLTFRKKLRSIHRLIRCVRIYNDSTLLQVEHCAFAFECAYAREVCLRGPLPVLKSVERRHKVACTLYEF